MTSGLLFLSSHPDTINGLIRVLTQTTVSIFLSSIDMIDVNLYRQVCRLLFVIVPSTLKYLATLVNLILILISGS